MSPYLSQLGAVKNALIAIDAAKKESDLETSLSSGFKIVEEIMGVSVLRDTALQSPRRMFGDGTTPSQTSLSFSTSASHETFVMGGDLCGTLFRQILLIQFSNTLQKCWIRTIPSALPFKEEYRDALSRDA